MGHNSSMTVDIMRSVTNVFCKSFFVFLLLFDTSKVIQELPHPQACLLQWPCLSRCIRGLAHRVWFRRHQNIRCAGLHFSEYFVVVMLPLIRSKDDASRVPVTRYATNEGRF
jgi:hypothetical protein